MSEDAKPKFRQRHPWLILIGVALVVVIAISLSWRVLSAPKQGIVYSVKTPTAREIASTQTKTITGRYLQFSYRGDYNINRQSDPKTAPADDYLLTTTGSTGGEHLAISAGPTKVTTVDEASGVASRRLDADKYSEEKRTINGAPALVFTRINGEYERTLFVYKAGIVTSVSLTGNNDSFESNAEFEKLVDSLHWL